MTFTDVTIRDNEFARKLETVETEKSIAACARRPATHLDTCAWRIAFAFVETAEYAQTRERSVTMEMCARCIETMQAARVALKLEGGGRPLR